MEYTTKYTKEEAIDKAAEFLKKVRQLEEEYSLSFNSDRGDIYLSFKTSEEGKHWDSVKIGWDGDGTGLKVKDKKDRRIFFNDIIDSFETIKNTLLTIDRDNVQRIIFILQNINYETLEDKQIENIAKFLKLIDEDLRFDYLLYLVRINESVEHFLYEFKSDYDRINEMGINI